MPYRTPGKVIVRKEYKFSLTKAEAVKAISEWLENNHLPGMTPMCVDPEEGSSMVYVRDGEMRIQVRDGRPLCMEWAVHEGEEKED